MTAKYYNPYNNVGDDGRWLKAQFHCHNWRLPSTEEKEEGFADILIEYKAAGYDLVMHSGQQGWYDTSTASAEVGVATVNGQEYIDYDGILLVGSTSFFSGEPQTAVDACRAQGALLFTVIRTRLPGTTRRVVSCTCRKTRHERFVGSPASRSSTGFSSAGHLPR